MGNPLARFFGRRPEPKPEAKPAEGAPDAAPAQPADDAQAGAEAQPKRGRADHLAAWRFKPGQSGNPGGRPKGRSITAELQELAECIDEQGDTVKQRIAKSLLLAAEHNLQAARIVLDRIDGRVPATIPVKPNVETLADLVAEAEKLAENHVPAMPPAESHPE